MSTARPQDSTAPSVPARRPSRSAAAAPGDSAATAVRRAAARVLRANDTGHMTVAAPALYPHQWSWDSAFIAAGLAHISVPRAIAELRSLLAAQWRTGMIPHIVFGDAGDYFPGPERWHTEVADARPAGVRTSGICQPPVHSLALAAILRVARDRGRTERGQAESFVRDTLDRWVSWHHWLGTVRDPDGTGLIEIHHSWESGMDDSPRWDGPYSRVVPGAMEPFERRDLVHVAASDERPADLDYRRYVWLVDQMAAARYDDVRLARTSDFRVADVFGSALLALASDVLAEIADSVGRHDVVDDLEALAEQGRNGVRTSIDPDTGLARDRDRHTGEWLATRTVAGFAPLLCGADEATITRQRDLFLGPQWCGHPGLRFALPPSTAPADEHFRPRRYWRGPQWPVVSWLFGWAADRRGDTALTGHLRRESLRQLADGTFAEYYEPLTGDPLGSRHQSWTAAVALDWIARDGSAP